MKRVLMSRITHFLILGAFLFAAVLGAASDNPLKKRAQYLMFDHYNKTNPRPVPADKNRVYIIDINDDSLKRLGQWPWPRTVMADLVTNLNKLGARVVAFDGVLAEPDRTSPQNIARTSKIQDPELEQKLEAIVRQMPDNDAVLAKAIDESGNFIAGFTYGYYSDDTDPPRLARRILMHKATRSIFEDNITRFDRAASFIDPLEDRAAGVGSFMASPDIDGILRRVSMLFTDGTSIYPALSLESVRLDEKGYIKAGPNKAFENNPLTAPLNILIGDKKIPVGPDAKLWIYFRDMLKERDYIPAYQVIEPHYHDEIRDRVEDHIIFIGSSAEGLKDLRSFPIAHFRPGVEAHANVVEQILTETYLLRPDIFKASEQYFILAVGLVMVLAAPFINALWLMGVCVLFIASAFYFSLQAFHVHGALLDPVYPSLCVFVLFLTSAALTYARSEAERKRIRQAFGLYISPHYMKELTRNPDQLKLGGQIKTITVMFTDIRNFTSISENLSPEELITLMNDFLTPMSDRVMANKGTIDKYMGDAMMAFWNAPLDDPKHPRNACIAALEMRDALDPVNEQVRQKALERGDEPVLLRAGIGINTGQSSVGNMGSRQRFAYSALGDAVNLASRLEGQTKFYGVDILMGEETWKGVQDMAWLEIDLIRVKGRRQPERIFTLLGRGDMAALDGFKAWHAVHQDMISAYRAREFDRARTLLGTCRNMHSAGELEVFYNLMCTRIAGFIDAPPGPDWSGVYEATEK